jgi:hypothetical protein
MGMTARRVALTAQPQVFAAPPNSTGESVDFRTGAFTSEDDASDEAAFHRSRS